MFGKKKANPLSKRLDSIKAAPQVRFDKSLPKRKGREATRRSAYKIGVIRLYNNEVLRCVVKDVSQSGARVVLEGSISLPNEFLFTIEGFKGEARVKRVWQREKIVGVQYV
ncbi:MAG: PilZ domain-containing protein [Pseudomonadota bacterium]